MVAFVGKEFSVREARSSSPKENNLIHFTKLICLVSVK